MINLPIGQQNILLNCINLPKVDNLTQRVTKKSTASLMFPNSVDQPCRHEYFDKNGICEDCGFECTDHNWDKGQCTVCGLECDHFDHDGHCCLDCGMEYYEFANFDFDIE